MSASSQSLLQPPSTALGTGSRALMKDESVVEPVVPPTPGLPLRPAWVEIDLARLRRNFELIAEDKPRDLRVLSVVKDEGYGHGALAVARAALNSGAGFLALSTLE